MTIDFFVHPDWPSKSSIPIIEVGRYEEKLHDLIRKSDLPILIRAKSAGSWENHFSREQILDSFSFSSNSAYGAVIPSEWGKLKRIINGHSEFLVHGAYFEECTYSFAAQLFNCIKYDKNIFAVNAKSFKDMDRPMDLVELQSIHGEFLNSTVKLGSVMVPPLRFGRSQKEIHLPGSEGYPYGNAVYQFMGQSTEPFGIDRVRIFQP